MPGSLATRTAALGLALHVAITATGSTSANSIGQGARRIGSPRFSRTPHIRRADGTGCDANDPTAGDSFVGVNDPNYENIASTGGSAVLGGGANEACGLWTVIEGGFANVAAPNGPQSLTADAVEGGEENLVSDTGGMIGAGLMNSVGNGEGSFIAAGGNAPSAQYYGNSTEGAASFVGAGVLNDVSGNGSFIGAGGYLYANNGSKGPGNAVSGSDSFIGAGDQNAVASNYAFIGAGSQNALTSAANYASILGGVANSASGVYSAVLGGYGNKATGSYGIVAGGNSNAAAGTLSFAAGYHASAGHNGSFVWSDYSTGSAAIKDTAANQFIVRASGGTYIYSNEAATAGVKLAPGSGTWASLSDRNAKTSVVPLNDATVLAKVAALPVSTWQYTSERGVRHAGPMAQDFYSAFGIGEDDRHITSIDEDGIAIAAIEALYRKNVALQARNTTLATEVASREAQTRRRITLFETADAVREQQFDNLAAATRGPRVRFPIARPMAARSRRRRDGSTGCTTDYDSSGDFFIGVKEPNADLVDIAAGSGSGVLGGQRNQACDTYTAVGGGADNVIGGGGNDAARDSVIGGGYGNLVTASDAMIGAGESNEVDGNDSFIGAGGIAPNGQARGNVVTGVSSFVGAGLLNRVSGNGSLIGAGGTVYATTGATTPGNQVSGDDSFIGSGDQNTLAANDGFVGSGTQNALSSAATYASILGGLANSASGEYSAVLGGYGNKAQGAYGIVAGGNGDAATGTLSFAAGYHASATHNGSFVWSDYSSGSATIKDTAANQFVVRASGGTSIYSNEAVTSGVKLAPGSGAWANLSDRNAKTAIVPLDDASVLAKVSNLPISTWQYTTEPGVRHAGPMAQDFYAAFGIGEDERHIASIDEDGIALAAIKALYHENASLEKRNAALEATIANRDAQTRVRFSKLAARSDVIDRRLNMVAMAMHASRRDGGSVPGGQSRRRRGDRPSCTADYGTADQYFVGVTNSQLGNFAGGEDSAVLGGEDDEACDTLTAIGGGYSNVIGSGSAQASMIEAGENNTATGSYAMIGAGDDNELDGGSSFIAAGGEPQNDAAGGNVVEGNNSFVGTGISNTVDGNASFIGAGGYLLAQEGSNPQTNRITGNDSIIGAGDENVIASDDGFIGSGSQNTLSSTATYASILGGLQNAASGVYSAVLGGYGNSATGSYAIVAGGNSDTAGGTLTFAAGYHASASHNGSFIWSDYSSGSATVKDTAVNQFVVRASGGTYVYSNEAATAGVKLSPGSGAWASLSDRNAKTNIVPLNDASILEKLSRLPVGTWQYKTENGVRHAGPMAQDFYAAFGIGEDDRHITSIDEDGIALAAIKALHHEDVLLAARDAALAATMTAHDAQASLRLSKLDAANATLARRLDALSSAGYLPR